jgi:hypothetical protein
MHNRILGLGKKIKSASELTSFLEGKGKRRERNTILFLKRTGEGGRGDDDPTCLMILHRQGEGYAFGRRFDALDH